MTILDEIFEAKKEEVKLLRKDFTLSRFSDLKFFSAESFSLYEKIKDKNDLSIIAEIKQASPSKGVIRQNFNPVDIAKQYIDAQVSGISILTDKNFFKGSLDYLLQVAEFKNLPLLRKDFIIDEYQVFEAKANGADAILLICELLSEAQLKELTNAANELNLEVLLELHSVDQLPKVNFELNNIVGINNRDLRTFKVDVNNSIEISKLLPNNIAVVAESGFSNKADVEKIKNNNIDALLIGEYFMRSENIYNTVKEFQEWCQRER